MAENVLIAGFNGVEEWASETTAKLMLAELSKLNQNNVKIQKLIEKSARSVGGKSGELNPKLVDDFNKELQKSTEELKEESSARDEATDKLKQFGVGVLQGLITAGGFLVGMWQKQINVFSDLYRSGIVVAGGYEGMADSLTMANLSLNDFATVVKAYSNTVNKFGEKRFAATVGVISKELVKFGITSKESAEVLGTYLKSQQTYTNLNRRSIRDTAESAIEFGRNLDDLSKITGESRDQMRKQIEAASENTDVWSFINSLPEAQRENVKKSFDLMAGVIKDPTLLNQLQGLATAPFQQINETYQSLAASGSREFADTLSGFTDKVRSGSIKSAEQMEIEVQALAKKATGADLQRLRVLADSGNQQARQTLQLLQGVNKVASEMSAVDKVALKQALEAEKTRAKFMNAWSKVTGFFERVLPASLNSFQGLTDGLESIAKVFDPNSDAMKTVSKAITHIVDAIFGKDGKIGDAADFLAENISAFANWLSNTIDSLMASYKEFTSANPGEGIWGFIKSQLGTLLQEAVTGLMSMLGKALWEGIKSLMGAIVDGLTTVIGGLLLILGGAIVALLAPAWAPVVGAIMVVSGLFVVLGNALSALWKLIKSFLPSSWFGGKEDSNTVKPMKGAAGTDVQMSNKKTDQENRDARARQDEIMRLKRNSDAGDEEAKAKLEKMLAEGKSKQSDPNQKPAEPKSQDPTQVVTAKDTTDPKPSQVSSASSSSSTDVKDPNAPANATNSATAISKPGASAAEGTQIAYIASLLEELNTSNTTALNILRSIKDNTQLG